jgi:hypothetical protein
MKPTAIKDIEFDSWVQEAKDIDILELAKSLGGKFRRYGTEWKGGCPLCGGDDRMFLKTRTNGFGSRKCGVGGSTIDLVMHCQGMDFLRAVEFITGRAPVTFENESEAERAKRLIDLQAKREAVDKARVIDEKKSYEKVEALRRQLISLYCMAASAKGTIVELYLKRRGLELPPHSSLKFASHVDYYHGSVMVDGRDSLRIIHTGPAMLAPFIRPDGRLGGVHITWIDLKNSNGKVRLYCPDKDIPLSSKKMKGKVKGCYIPLVGAPLPLAGRDFQDIETLDIPHLVVGEGIETVLSMWKARPTAGDAFWAAGSIDNLCGGARGTVAHPTDTVVTMKGDVRPRRVASDVPDMKVEPMPIPPSTRRLSLLQDGDSDPFETDLALRRGQARHLSPTCDVRIIKPALGQDFNDMLQKQAA